MILPTGRWWVPASVVSGVLLAQFLTVLPPQWIIVLLAAASLPCLFFPRIRPGALLVLACCWTLFQFHLRLADRLDASRAGQKFRVSGIIDSIPSVREEHVRFLFKTDEAARDQGLPGRLLVYWYRDWPELKPGQRWNLLMKVNPPWGKVNFQGADSERWYFARGIGGRGTVYEGAPSGNHHSPAITVDRMRMAVIEQIAGQVPDARQSGIVQALATADRSGIDPEYRRLLNATGTSHLLAISGLHVGLAAAGGMWIGRLLTWMAPGRFLLGLTLPLMIGAGLCCATVYAALAGFGVPTVRSVLMLLTVTGAVLLSRAIHPFRAWVNSLALVSLLNPFALLEAGFWFSYLAVAALLLVFLPRTGRIDRFRAALAAQAAVIVVLIPVSAAVFHSFSPLAFAANLAAIPWVSLLVVPAVLLGLVASLFSNVASGLLWKLAGEASDILFLFLGGVDSIQGALSLLVPPSGLQAVLALLGGFLLLMPRGIPHRWLGVFLLWPLFAPAGNRTPPGVIELEFLDAGQGTSVLVNSGDRTMLYDSGPGDGNGIDLVRSVIDPALAARGAGSLRQVVISHADMDHAGGLETMLARHGSASYFGNFPDLRPGVTPCNSPMEWNWPGVRFEVLHPAPGLPYLGNDSSCVVSVQAGVHRVLLGGDISRSIENRLVLDNLPRHSVLLVPHHGSLSSSSNAFIRQIVPDIAIATTSLGNRFGFPREVIRDRYAFRGTEFLSTSDCGAIRLVLQPDGGVNAMSARRERNRIWRWPAAPNCP